MSATITGIKAVGICNKSSLASPVNFIPIGLRGKGSVKNSAFGTTEDFRGRKLRNMTNVLIDMPSLQMTLSNLSTIMGTFIPAGGVDVQVILMDGTLMNFNGTNFMGIGFEKVIGNTERYTKVFLEAAYRNEIYRAITQATTPAALSDFSGGSYLGAAGILLSGYKPANQLTTLTSGGTALFDDDDLLNYKVTVRDKSTKNKNNRNVCDFFEVMYEIEGLNASAAKVYELLGKSILPQITLAESYDEGTKLETIDCDEGVLAMDTEPDWNDDRTKVKLTFSGLVPRNKFIYSLINSNANWPRINFAA